MPLEALEKVNIKRLKIERPEAAFDFNLDLEEVRKYCREPSHLPLYVRGFLKICWPDVRLFPELTSQEVGEYQKKLKVSSVMPTVDAQLSVAELMSLLTAYPEQLKNFVSAVDDAKAYLVEELKIWKEEKAWSTYLFQADKLHFFRQLTTREPVFIPDVIWEDFKKKSQWTEFGLEFLKFIAPKEFKRRGISTADALKRCYRVFRRHRLQVSEEVLRDLYLAKVFLSEDIRISPKNGVELIMPVEAPAKKKKQPATRKF